MSLSLAPIKFNEIPKITKASTFQKISRQVDKSISRKHQNTFFHCEISLSCTFSFPEWLSNKTNHSKETYLLRILISFWMSWLKIFVSDNFSNCVCTHCIQRWSIKLKMAGDEHGYIHFYYQKLNIKTRLNFKLCIVL